MELNNDKLRATLVPEIGGSIIDFSVCRHNQWIAIMRPGEYPLTTSSNASSFVLIPYSNRLRNGQFTFKGKPYHLRDIEKHAIHGDVRNRPLKTTSHTRDRIVMEFDSEKFPDLNFPFPFFARMTYTLEDSVFWSHIELTNSGNELMPAGCGFHPYFNRWLPGSTGEVELQMNVNGVYPADKEIALPTGPVRSVSSNQDFHIMRPLDLVLDHCFAGWDRRATIHWPGIGISAHIQALPGMEHVIIYSPEGKNYFALEPVTHANDGFNLWANGDKNCGVVVLKPGQVLKAGFGILVEA